MARKHISVRNKRPGKARKKGDIAVNTIMILFVSVISILLLLALFTGKMPTFAKQLYCATFYKIQSQSFIPGGIRADTAMCDEFDSQANIHYIFEETDVLETFGDGSTVQRFILNTGKTHQESALELSNATYLNATVDVVLRSANVLGGDRDCIPFTLRMDHTTIQITGNQACIGDPFSASFYLTFNDSISSCDNYPCDRLLRLYPDVPTPYSLDLAMQNLKIYYKKCFVAEEILASMLACWERAGFGKMNEDYLCDELLLSDECYDSYELDSDDIADLIIDEDLCEYLPIRQVPPHPTCPAGDSVDFQLREVDKQTNILVEYDADTKRIRVS